MANEQNLIPLDKRTREEQREIAKQGGIASGKARREKADFKKKCQMWMDEAIVAHDEKGNPMTGSDLMVAIAAKGIAEGSPEFWKIMRDTAGYKPVDKVIVAEVNQEDIDAVEKMVRGCADNDEETGD